MNHISLIRNNSLFVDAKLTIIILLISITGFITASGQLFAQDQKKIKTDSASTKSDLKDIPNDLGKQKHSPKIASIMSAALPGLGQVYNKKYWKIPIIYAGFAVLAYSINFSNTRYQDYKQAYIWRIDTSAATIDKYDLQLDNGEPKYSEDALLTLKDYYLRNRDLSVILTGFLYLLNIIDATVDAHFYTYDVSNNLTLSIKPVLQLYASSLTPSMGMRLTFKL